MKTRSGTFESWSSRKIRLYPPLSSRDLFPGPIGAGGRRCHADLSLAQRRGHWVPATSAGTTVLLVARGCKSLAALALALAFAATPAMAQQQNQIGLVKVVDGEAFALRADERSALGVGTPIYVEDVVETEAGSVGLTFKDGSRLSIGPNSRIQFTEFEFAPAEGRLAFLIDFFRGTLLYVSGVIAKLSPDSVKVQTPVATVAVRGTRFLAEVEGD